MIPRGACSLYCAVAVMISTGCHDVTGDEPCTLPSILSTRIVLNPANVLSVFIVARTEGADSVAVRYSVAGRVNSDITPWIATAAAGDSVMIPVLALYAGTHYTMTAAASGRCGSVDGAPQQVMTDSLPSGLHDYEVTGGNPSPGFVVFSTGSYGVAIDNAGRVVWYYRFPVTAGLNFQPQPNGRYLSKPSTPPAPAGSDILEIDPLGRLTRTIGCMHGMSSRIHDFIAMPDESYWVMCDEIRTFDLSSTGGPSAALVLGVRVQHVSADRATLFEWSAFDHLQVDFGSIDPQDRIAGAYNWTHANAIDVDSAGYLYISFRNLNEVAKIDTRDGKVVWRFGGRANQFRFAEGGSPAFVHQHGLRSAGPNCVILLDNLGDASGSRGELYELDEKTLTVRMVRTFGAGTGLIAQIGGTVQRLPNGHTLVSFGNAGRIEEFDSDGASVWRVTGNPGYVFRAHRIQSLYRAQ